MDLAAYPHQTLLDLLPEAFVAVDVATRRFLLANAAAERLTGYTRAELEAMTPGDVLDLADGSRLELAFETLSLGTTSRREWMLRARGGRVIPIGVTSVPILLDGRLVIQMLVHDLSTEDPAAAQRTLLALANERLSVSLDYEATLRAVVGLIVPRIADACTVDLRDQTGQPCRAARGFADPSSVDGIAIEIASSGHADPPVAAAVAEPDAEPTAGLAIEAASGSGAT